MNELKAPDINSEDKKSGQFKSKGKLPKITETIGRGEDAKNSFVYLTLKWTFISACILMVLLCIDSLCCLCCKSTNTEIPDLRSDISLVWDLATPLITLALGYAFGQSRR